MRKIYTIPLDTSILKLCPLINKDCRRKDCAFFIMHDQFDNFGVCANVLTAVSLDKTQKFNETIFRAGGKK